MSIKMLSFRVDAAILASSINVQGNAIARDIPCSVEILATASLGAGVAILSSIDVAIGNLSVPDYSGGTFLNTLQLVSYKDL